MKAGENVFMELEREEASIRNALSSIPSKASALGPSDGKKTASLPTALSRDEKKVPEKSVPLKKRHKWHSQQAINKQKKSNTVPSSVRNVVLVPVSTQDTSIAAKKPTSSLSIGEARVVLALVELAEPLTVDAQLATL